MLLLDQLTSSTSSPLTKRAARVCALGRQSSGDDCVAIVLARHDVVGAACRLCVTIHFVKDSTGFLSAFILDKEDANFIITDLRS